MLDLALPPGDSEQQYDIHPASRGDIPQGRLFVRYRTQLGLAERWAVASLRQSVRVMPDLVRARNYALYLVRSRQVEMEKRRRRQRGIGREFEALREYRQGDEMRTVCWPATARRHQLITRTYQVERSQAVWIVLDAGRLMRAQVHDSARELSVSKLDYAVDAALALAQVAAQSGDRVGLLAYGRTIQQSVGIGRGAQHIRTILNALAQVKSEASEADHTLGRANAAPRAVAARSNSLDYRFRGDSYDTRSDRTCHAHESQALGFVCRCQSTGSHHADADPCPNLNKTCSATQPRSRLPSGGPVCYAGLRDHGVLAIDLEPGRLTDAVINQYLEIKDRSLL